MRMQDKANGDSEKKSVGGISEQCVLQPQDERKAVQRRTFTRWMNVFLQRRDPPVEVHDLFTDIQDGQILMALLEELSGCKLLYRFRSSSQRIFRLNNISKALAFLDDRHVKLPGIDASGIADGIPSAVLNLVWNIILYFQVKEVSRDLQRHLSSSLSSLSTSSYPISSDLSPQPNDIDSYSCNTLPSKGRKAAREPQYHGKAIKTLLQWVQQCTSKFGVEVRNFGRSWRSGLAFLAMIKSINPDLVDLRESLTKQPRENIQLAFTIAHHSLDIPPLLEPEDVSGSSPDEQSIITYVSMFLYHCSDTDEDHTTDIKIAEIPSFGSLESVSSGETHADDPKAQALVQGLKKSSEQLLWKRWARRSSGSPLNTLLHTGEATSPFNKKKSRSQSILQPPSPLDASVVSQEIQSWMENVSVDQGDRKSKVDESHLSLSSEEGIYSLSALDSDEEDAYSYILDLNKEVFQPYNQLKRQVARVEEETEEDMFLSGEQTEESKHPNACKKTLNGSEHQEDSLAQHVEPEVRAQSGVNRTFQWDKSESSPREMAHSAAVFDTEPEEDSRSKEERGDKRVVRGQSNEHDYYEEEMIKEITEYATLVEHGCDEREALMGETKNSKLFDLDSWKIEVEKETEGGLLEKCGQVIENNKKEEENVPKFEEGQKRKSGKEQEEEDKDEERETQQSVVNLESFKVGLNEIKTTDEIVYEVRGAGATRINTKEENDGKENGMDMEELTSEDDEEECSDDVMNSEVRAAEQKDRNLNVKRQELTGKTATIAAKTAPRNDTNGGVNVHGVESFWTPAWPATSQSFREGGFIPQSSAAPCDITPLELEMLLVLWILLYCCFIF